jgi:hypothetical protein
MEIQCLDMSVGTRHPRTPKGWHTLEVGASLSSNQSIHFIKLKFILLKLVSECVQ